MDKVAIVNVVFGYSSSGSQTKHLYEYGKKNGYEAFAFYGRGDKVADDHVIRIDSKSEVYLHKILTLLTGYQGFFSNHATKKLLAKLKKENIRKVILLNIHGYYLNERKMLGYLKDNKVQTVYITPDEYAGLGKCCYSKDCEQYKTECRKCPLVRDYPKSWFFDRANTIFKRKKEVYEGFDTITFVGPKTNIAKFRESALIKDKPMTILSWGVDLELYKYEIDETLYEKYGIPRGKILILTAANYSNPRKGVKEYFFEIAKRLEGSEYHFINVAYDGTLKKDEIPKNMTTIKYLDDQSELSRLYAMSDLYLLASKADTMPISCLISFACETPVCCFYTSGLKYLAAKDSLAVKYCDDISVDAMEKVIRSTTRKDEATRRECRKLAVEEYSEEAFNKKVFDLFHGGKSE